MIITQTPFRISFFGGGTDFPSFYKKHGGAVISTTIDKYCFVYVRALPPFFKYKSHITYNEQEKVNSVDEIKHPLIREAMRRFGMNRIRLIYDADIPAQSGLGTSSSFAVGMVNAFSCMSKKRVDKRYLADEAILLEREILRESGGIQDQIASAFGGMNKLVFSSDGYEVIPLMVPTERKKALNENLMMFFTGFTRFSSDIQKETLSIADQKAYELSKILSLVTDAENILTDSNVPLSEFGKLLDYTWQIKRSLSPAVSTSLINDMYNAAINAGALGGKLLGAGGGGFLLIYAEKEHQERVQKALEKFIFVPFKFEDSASQIIHYEPETMIFEE